MTMAVSSANPVLRFLGGHMRLSIVFWVFGLTPLMLIAGAGRAFYTSNFVTIASSAFYGILWSWGLALCWVYAVVVFIALWNSAGRYTGQHLYGHSARAVGTALMVGGAVFTIETSTRTVDEALANEIRWLNASAPVLFDGSTRFDEAALGRDGNLSVYYTLLEPPESAMGMIQLEIDAYAALRASQCANPTLLAIFHKGRAVTVHYHDSSLQKLFEVAISANDCVEAWRVPT